MNDVLSMCRLMQNKYSTCICNLYWHCPGMCFDFAHCW